MADAGLTAGAILSMHLSQSGGSEERLERYLKAADRFELRMARSLLISAAEEIEQELRARGVPISAKFSADA